MTVLGIVALAVAAGVVVLGPAPRIRAWAALTALVLAPALLWVQVSESPQVQALLSRPALAAGLAVAGLGVVAALTFFFARRPQAFAIAAVAALPFRVPIEAGGATANLLVPLYVVIAAGSLAWLLPNLRSDSAEHEIDFHRDLAADDPGAERDVRAPDPGWLERMLVASVVLYALGAIYTSDVPKALAQIVFFYVPFMLMFARLRELHWTPRLLAGCGGVLLALATVFVVIGFVEFQTRHLLLNPKVIASNQVEAYFRVNSLFFDPNIYGRFLSLVMIGVAAMMLWARRPRYVLLAAGMLVLLWAGLVLTLSQSSFTALLFGLAVLALLRFPPMWTLAASVVAVGAALALVLAAPGMVGLDIGDREDLDRVTSGRFELVAGGVALAAERPLTGHGSGSFSREYRRAERTSSQNATAASHTTPVTVAAEQGLPGLAVYLVMMGVALLVLGRGARRSAIRAAIAAAFVALSVHTMVYAAFLEDPMTWVLLAVGGVLAHSHARARRRGRRQGGAEEPAATAAGGGTGSGGARRVSGSQPAERPAGDQADASTRT